RELDKFFGFIISPVHFLFNIMGLIIRTLRNILLAMDNKVPTVSITVDRYIIDLFDSLIQPFDDSQKSSWYSMSGMRWYQLLSSHVHLVGFTGESKMNPI